jgi:DNA-binding beta-propeller fold protein YncE
MRKEGVGEMLELRGYVDLPPPRNDGTSEFDHGDVHRATGHVFLAHTAANTVEIIDGLTDNHLMTIPGCPEGSGVLCAQKEGIVFAAARGAGKVLVLDARSGQALREIAVGPRPNGLAWDMNRKRLLVADVQENQALLLAPVGATWDSSWSTYRAVPLPGRPRWSVYDAPRSRFLVNIREPACVAVLSAVSGEQVARWPVSAAGPHGLDLDGDGGRAFVACDAGVVVALNLEDGRELGHAPIAGAPDAIWYNARREQLYVAIEDPGVVDVIDTQTMTLEEEIVTERGAHTTAFDPDRQRLYVFLPATCRAAIFDCDTPDGAAMRRREAQSDCEAVNRWEDEGGAPGTGTETR